MSFFLVSQEPSNKRVRPLGRVTSLASLISPVKNGAVRRFGQTIQVRKSHKEKESLKKHAHHHMCLYFSTDSLFFHSCLITHLKSNQTDLNFASEMGFSHFTPWLYKSDVPSELQASLRGDGRMPGGPQKPCSKAAVPTPPKRRNSTLWSETLDIHQKGTFSTQEIKRQEVRINIIS